MTDVPFCVFLSRVRGLFRGGSRFVFTAAAVCLGSLPIRHFQIVLHGGSKSEGTVLSQTPLALLVSHP